MGASKSWGWTEIEEQAFIACKGILSEEALLHYPDYTIPFVIQTDASAVGLGAVLLQVKSDQEKPIWYASRALSSHESKYHARELECLAVKWALRRFRYIIEGCRVIVITDHESLIWLMRQDVPQGRLARWVLELQGTDFSVLHRSGATNCNADALSRAIPIQQVWSLIISNDTNVTWKERLLTAQRGDVKCRELFQLAEAEAEDYLIVEEFVCKKIKVRNQEWTPVVVPEALRKEVLQSYHADPQAGHYGTQMTFEIIRRRYFWEKMHADIKKWTQECETCSKTKYARKRPPGKMGEVHPEKFNEVLCIDHVGPFGPRKRKWILVMMDFTSRWPEVEVVTSLSSRTTAKCIRDNWFCRYGAPDAILTDNGTSFKGSPIRKLLNVWQVAHHRTTPHHPQANPVERLHGDLKRLLRAALEEGTGWEERLQESVFCLRNRICRSLGVTPGELVFGSPMRMPRDVICSVPDPDSNWESALIQDGISRERRKQTFDQNRRDVRYQPGELVYVKRPYPIGALVSPYIGPFEVRNRTGHASYYLKHKDSGQIIQRHVKDLKPGRCPSEEGSDVRVD